jgi:hypothetical protein
MKEKPSEWVAISDLMAGVLAVGTRRADALDAVFGR